MQPKRPTWPLEARPLKVLWPDDQPATRQPLSDLTLRLLYKQHYAPKRQRGASTLTAEAYDSLLNNLARWAGRDILARELGEDLAAEYLHWRRTQGDARRPGHGVAAGTANKDLRELAALHRFAARLGATSHPWNLEEEPEDETTKECWSIEQLALIIAACREQSGAIADIPAATWWEALILTLYDVGGRISATMALRWRDVKLPPKAIVPTVTLRSENQKQRADQCLPIAEETAVLLERLGHREGDALLFPWPADPPDRRGKRRWAALRAHYRKILARAGLPIERDDMFHRVRRTNGTYTVIVEGTIRAAQERLGHSSPSVTMRYLDRAKLQDRSPSHKPLPRPQLPAD